MAYILASKEGSIDVPEDGTIGNRATETGALAVMQASVFDRLRIFPSGDALEQQDAGEILSRLVSGGVVSQQSPLNTQFTGQVVTRINGPINAAARRALFARASDETHMMIKGPLLQSAIDDAATGRATLAAGRLLIPIPGLTTDPAIDLRRLLSHHLFAPTQIEGQPAGVTSQLHLLPNALPEVFTLTINRTDTESEE